MQTYRIGASSAPSCEREISLDEGKTNAISSIYHRAGSLGTQPTEGDQGDYISIYEATSPSATHVATQPRKLRWTKSGQIVSSRFNVFYAKLGQLATLPKNWDGCDTPRPSPISVRHAKQALNILANLRFEPNGIVPGGEGGIGITFRRPGKYADLEFFNDGEAMSSLHVRDGKSEPVIEDLDTNEPALQIAIEKIIEFLRSSD